ncbi:putative PTS system IIA component [Salmonella enterica subsp. enterica serovar Derby]|nr:putative PTS system IIA component [Salmonella enterica subsp. enterica serovar Derby]
MLGWVISCHDDRAQEMLEGLEKKYGRWRSVGRSISGVG